MENNAYGEKLKRLFTIKPGPRAYSYSHSKVQWDVYTYPSFACEMIWATIQADLLVLRLVTKNGSVFSPCLQFFATYSARLQVHRMATLFGIMA